MFRGMFDTAIVKLKCPGSVLRFLFTIFFTDLLIKFVISSLLISFTISYVAKTMIVKLVCSVTAQLITPIISLIKPVQWTSQPLDIGGWVPS